MIEPLNKNLMVKRQCLREIFLSTEYLNDSPHVIIQVEEMIYFLFLYLLYDTWSAHLYSEF